MYNMRYAKGNLESCKDKCGKPRKVYLFLIIQLEPVSLSIRLSVCLSISFAASLLVIKIVTVVSLSPKPTPQL